MGAAGRRRRSSTSPGPWSSTGSRSCTTDLGRVAHGLSRVGRRPDRGQAGDDRSQRRRLRPGSSAQGDLVDRRHGRSRSQPAAAWASPQRTSPAPTFRTRRSSARSHDPRSRPDADFSLTFDDGPDPRHTRPSAGCSPNGATVRPSSCSVGPCEPIRVCSTARRRRPRDRLPRRRPSPARIRFTAGDRRADRRLGRGGRGSARIPGARLVRTPHGVRSPWLTSVARRRGYAVCGWDGSVFDTAEPGAATIARRVVSLLRPGAVVLLHDGDGSGRGGSRAQTVAAARRGARRRGSRAAALGDARLAARSTGADVSHSSPRGLTWGRVPLQGRPRSTLWLSGGYDGEVYAIDTRSGRLICRVHVRTWTARSRRVAAARPLLARPHGDHAVTDGWPWVFGRAAIDDPTASGRREADLARRSVTGARAST